MNENNYILLSLGDKKSKQISQSISNETARKILAYLSNKKDASETEISEKLKIPITTIHYNIQNLNEAGLIEKKKFMWSSKGNKIYYYSLANKFVVIAPKKSVFEETLKKIIPIALIATIFGIILKYYNSYFAKTFSKTNLISTETFQKSGDIVTTGISQEAVTSFNKTMENIDVTQVSNYILIPDYALFFLFGAWFVIILFILYNFIKR